MRETEGESKSAACCLVKAQEYIYTHTYISVFKISNFFNSHKLPGVEGGDDVCAGSEMAMLVAAEFGGGAKMCEDFYYLLF